MKKIAITMITIGLVTLTMLQSRAFCQESGKTAFKKFSEPNVFSFEVPASWQQVLPRQVEQYCSVLEELLPYFSPNYGKLFEQISQDAEIGIRRVPFMVAFFGPKNEVKLQAFIILTSPDDKENFLEDIYNGKKNDNEKNLENGQIHKIISQSKTEINGMPAVETVIEREDEPGKPNRHIDYYFYSPKWPRQAARIEIICYSDKYPVYEGVLKQIVNSFRVITPADTKSLIAALKDNHEYVRIHAIEALGEAKDKEAVESLLAIVNNRSAGSILRWKAVHALGDIKDTRAVQSLINILKNKENIWGWGVDLNLQSITGEDFGDDAAKWQQWWDANKTK